MTDLHLVINWHSVLIAVAWMALGGGITVGALGFMLRNVKVGPAW